MRDPNSKLNFNIEEDYGCYDLPEDTVGYEDDGEE